MELTTPFSAMLTAMRCRALTAKAVTANTLKKDAIYNGLSYALTDDCSRGYDLKSYIAEKVQLEESWIRNSYLFEIKFTVGAIAVTGEVTPVHLQMRISTERTPALCMSNKIVTQCLRQSEVA
ncbi:hypothetical protein AFLA_002487 [Aspergillus flavus NRRL3357]|nr:hypothetical protein AFLA_002487 [Aspergillus flavus NRRL3357]